MKKYTRKEMREEMEIRGFSPKAITIYINHIINLAAFSGKPPHKLSLEDIHKFQVFLVHEKQVSWSAFNQSVCAIRFFLTMLSVMSGLSSIFHSKKSIKLSR